jgi:hypothetical protein
MCVLMCKTYILRVFVAWVKKLEGALQMKCIIFTSFFSEYQIVISL